MAQQIIAIGETGQNALNAINGNFTELYGNITQPLKFPGQAANFSTIIPANTFVAALFAVLVAGAASVAIGLTPNGTEISPAITPDANGLQVLAEQYFANSTTLYFTITGGTLSFRINVIPNFY